MRRPFDFVVACAPTALRVTRLEGEAEEAPSPLLKGIRKVDQKLSSAAGWIAATELNVATR